MNTRAASHESGLLKFRLAGVLMIACVTLTVGAGAADAPSDAGSGTHGLPTVTNPYLGKADAIAQGKDLFASKACSGCHGAGGGGGMGPPVINSVWIYGSDETTLFNLIKLGSVGLRAKGYTRTGTESVVGDMPGFAGNVSDDEVLKMLAFIRSKADGNAQ
jgi:mono/diheme cytochrome c family protein